MEKVGVELAWSIKQGGGGGGGEEIKIYKKLAFLQQAFNTQVSARTW